MSLIKLLKSGISALADLIRPRQFLHLTGQNLDKADLRINGTKVDLAEAVHKPAQGHISEYFTLKSGRTTYVLWNNPEAPQHAIQKGRRNHIDLGDAADRTLEVSTGRFGASFTAAAENAPSLPGLLEEARISLQEKLAAARFHRSATFTG